ncbi:MAG: flagellar biosynthesis anti-sigma factor FlgM [Planctomycetota bacterium]|nr:flagellar biosynthesis anti-sigma factor FlgM [Planctomycetota bacterium]MCX8039688.1 flagellar biosynthesis anti-sigma factor FlgM [Planctomycetota bacterium]MDW8372897.1 flagellar biosynthesis anti-sigma factor FlgM [Planctomycetota bacterium]
MEIHGSRPVDPAARRRQLEAARGPAERGAAAPAPLDASFAPGDSRAIASLVEALKRMEPTDVQRVAELKQRIADGRYRADPDELADLLLGRAR